MKPKRECGRQTHCIPDPEYPSEKDAENVRARDTTKRRDSALVEAATALRDACKHSVTLYVAAVQGKRRFALTDQYGDPVWFGPFYEKDLVFKGSQQSADLSVSQKALFVAQKAGEKIGASHIRCQLIVSAEWLCHANRVGSQDDDGRSGGKARSLGEAALKKRVALTVSHVGVKDNPATRYARGVGFQTWKTADLGRLVRESCT